MAIETLTERRRRSALDEIARAALELFIRDGFDSTSVETIAAAAGCSPRTVYRYFGTKEELLFHELPSLIEGLRLDIDRRLLGGQDPWRAVSEALVALSTRLDAGGSDALSQRLSLCLAEPTLRARYTLYLTDAERVIAESLRPHCDTAEGRDDLPELIAAAAVGAYRVAAMGTPKSGRALTRQLTGALATLGVGLARKGI